MNSRACSRSSSRSGGGELNKMRSVGKGAFCAVNGGHASLCPPTGLARKWRSLLFENLNSRTRECALPLPLWERSDRIDRCDPGEGFRSVEGPEPLTPTLSHRGRGSSLPLPRQQCSNSRLLAMTEK